MRELRVVVVEDREADCDLLVLALRRGGYDVHYTRVETAEDMRAALASRTWDIVISDYSLPRFSAPAALAVLKETEIDIPFIIVSGTVDEEVAVESMRAGAHDFMAKGKLTRLLPAIERELREAALRAERRTAQQMRDLFISVAGHELRTPLTVLLCYVELAERTPQGAPVPRRILGGISQASVRLRHVVDQLTTMLTVQEFRPPLELGDLSISRIVRDAAADAQPFVELRRLSLTVDVPANDVPIRADGTKLRDVIDNLLLNAIKFTPDGGHIGISVRRAEDGAAEIRVIDDGDGLDDASLSRIFEPFFVGFDARHHSSGRYEYRSRGMGLGLTVAKAFVEMHGGRIDAQSAPNRGTTMTVTLPADAEAFAPQPPKVSESRDAPQVSRNSRSGSSR